MLLENLSGLGLLRFLFVTVKNVCPSYLFSKPTVLFFQLFLKYSFNLATICWVDDQVPSKPNSKDTHLYSTVLVKACCAYSVAPSYHRDSTFAVPSARRTLCVHDWLLLILQGLILRIIFISEELKRPACTIPPRVSLVSSYSLHNIDHILLIILIAYLFIVRFFTGIQLLWRFLIRPFCSELYSQCLAAVLGSCQLYIQWIELQADSVSWSNEERAS